jgi:hypothetical protein
VAQPTDESNATILPDPELNPLLNPLLATHMGRWAEVYFTSPPEKRAQAVSDLVRELASNSTPDPASSQRNDDKRVWGKVNDEADEVPSRKSADVFERTPQTYESVARESMICESTISESMMGESIICESCGHKNARQKFCGMCGTPLSISPENPPQQFAVAEPAATAIWDESNPPIGRAPEGEPESVADSIPGPEYHQISQNLRWSPTENNPAEFRPLSDYEFEPASHGYRIYVGVAVAILLGLLVYMTWRSNTAFRSSGAAPSTVPQAVPAQKSEPAAVTEPATPTAQSSPKTNPTPEPATTGFAPQNRPAETGPEETRGAHRGAQVRPASRAVSLIASPAISTANQNGAEELAAAEKYLDAGPGAARDTRQAATWLWKAVAKQNSTATLLLSDLYLRGDGVTKSCDQARLLLDAAARKGATAAAERLRNLQAFGCR